MRTREEIKADYFKDCGYEDGDFITTDEDYLLEEIFKVQNQAKNNEVLDLVMLCYVDTYSANGYPTFKKGKFYPIEKSYLKGLLIMRNEQGIITKMSGEYWETIKDNFNKA